MSEKSGGQHLRSGSTVSRYEIVEVLGAGGFGITYKVFDTSLHCEAAMKEYLPAEFAVRDGDGVTVLSRSEEVAGEFDHGLTRFLDEARTLAKFKNRHIVRVSDYMEANGTAYLVMDYEEGESLRELLKRRGGSLSETEIKNIFIPILDGLKVVHEAGLLHRDIKPDNIYLRKEGPPVLLDFGAARQYTASRTRSVTATVTPGYAPFEQYQPDGDLGAWTDLYGLGATLYACVSGRPPVDAITRHAQPRADPMPLAQEVGADRYSAGLLRTIDWMLRPAISDRPQSVDAVLPCLQGRAEPPHDAVPTPAGVEATIKLDTGGDAGEALTMARGAPEPAARPPASGPRTGLIAGIAALVVVVAAGAGWWYVQDREAERLVEAQREQELGERRDTLRRADAALAAGRLTSPQGDNALALFRRVLESDPRNEQARRGMDELFAALVSRAEQAAAIGDFEEAGELLGSAGGIYPEHPDLVVARDRVRIAQQQMESAATASAQEEAQAPAQSPEPSEAEPTAVAAAEPASAEPASDEPEPAAAEPERSSQAPATTETAAPETTPADADAPASEETPAAVEPAPVEPETGQPDIGEPDAPELEEKPATTATAAPAASTEPGSGTAPGTDAEAGSDQVTENVDEFLTALMLESSQSEDGEDAEPAQAGSGQASSGRVRALLERAEAYRTASRLVAPEGDNAWALYRQVLAIDADNAAAKAGMKRIGDVFEQAAATMVAENRSDVGLGIVERGLKAVPDHAGLQRLRSRLASQ